MKQLARIFGILLSVILIAAQIGSAEVIKVERIVQLPDGSPAIGAKVLLRSFNKDGSLRAEKRVKTDAEGIVHSEIDVDEPERMRPRFEYPNAYLMIDTPDAPLTFERFSNWYMWAKDRVDPIRLNKEEVLRGKIVTPGGEPVNGAEVAVAGISMIREWFTINYPSISIITPELVTHTKEDGTFQMRGINVASREFRGNAKPRCVLTIRASVNGNSYAATASLVQPVANPKTDIIEDNLPKNTFPIYPAATIKGKVVNALDGKPIEGVQIKLRALPATAVAALIKPVMSKKDGSWEIKNVPSARQLFAITSHPDFGTTWKRIGFERRKIEGDVPRQYDGVDLKLRPWVTVRGRVHDVQTNKPPITPTKIIATYNDGFNDGTIAVGRAGTSGQMNPDGTFSMKMPMGYNSVLVRGVGYWEGGYGHPIALDIQPDKNPEFNFEVRRQYGFLVHFITDNPNVKNANDLDRVYNLLIRNKEGEVSSTNWGEWWMRLLYKPDDTLDISVTRMEGRTKKIVVPWTKLTPNMSDAPATDKDWPRKITLPSR